MTDNNAPSGTLEGIKQKIGDALESADIKPYVGFDGVGADYTQDSLRGNVDLMSGSAALYTSTDLSNGWTKETGLLSTKEGADDFRSQGQSLSPEGALKAAYDTPGGIGTRFTWARNEEVSHSVLVSSRPSSSFSQDPLTGSTQTGLSGGTTSGIDISAMTQIQGENVAASAAATLNEDGDLGFHARAIARRNFGSRTSGVAMAQADLGENDSFYGAAEINHRLNDETYAYGRAQFDSDTGSSIGVGVCREGLLEKGIDKLPLPGPIGAIGGILDKVALCAGVESQNGERPSPVIQVRKSIPSFK